MTARLWRISFWLLTALLVVYVIYGLMHGDVSGCNYDTETCGDPSWGNYPPY